MAKLGDAISRVVADHLLEFIGTGGGDLVPAFSNPVPAHVICEVIGLPVSDAPDLVALVLATGGLLDGVTDADGMAVAAEAALTLAAYSQRRLDMARELPPPTRAGLLAVLVEAIESGWVGADEVRDMLVVLISAGSETTSSLISTTVEVLGRERQLQDRLRENPAEIPDAIEAVLRDDGPFQFHYRWTPADVTLGSVHIPAGSRVLLFWAAANRPAPDTGGGPAGSVETKGPPPHFAFGRGLHFCIGAHLARLEARIAIEGLLRLTSSISLVADDPPTRRPSIFLRRHDRLPLLVR